jgi:hypothetical protein
MKKTLTMMILALAMSLGVPGNAQAQAPSFGPCPTFLPNGFWNVNANGFQGSLFIDVDAGGNVTGSINLSGDGVDTIRGFWTASACKITFLRVDGNTFNPANALNTQAYTGYLYPLLSSSPNGAKFMAGHFQATSLNGGAAARHIYGWHASR